MQLNDQMNENKKGAKKVKNFNNYTETVWTGEGKWERCKTATVTCDGESGWRVKVTNSECEEQFQCGVTDHWFDTETEAWDHKNKCAAEWKQHGWS